MKTTRTLYLFLFFLFQYVNSFSQLSLDFNRMRPGDELVKYQVEYKPAGASGKDILWDFSKLKTINKNYNLSYSSPVIEGDSCYVMGNKKFLIKEINDNDLIVAREHYTRYFYRFSGDSLFLLGHESPIVKLQYSTPCVMAVYPFNFGDSITNHYTATGLYSGQEPILTNGDITIEADGTGRMILPSGDTLSSVVRTRTIQTIVDELDTTSKKCKVLEVYRWYTKGYRYPVFETVENYSRQDSIIYFKTAFFYPPQEHFYIDNDPENSKILEELWTQRNKTNEETTSADKYINNNKKISILGLFTCELFPNPVVSELNISYEVNMETNVVFSLHSIDGFLIKQIPLVKRQPGKYTVKINCSSLFPGNYILRAVADGKIATGVVLKK